MSNADIIQEALEAENPEIWELALKAMLDESENSMSKIRNNISRKIFNNAIDSLEY